jgi:hypothetical protein
LHRWRSTPLWHCPQCGARLVSRNLWHTNRRIIKTVDYGPRWRGHYVRVASAADLDDELRAWLQESHDVVGMQSDLAERRPGHAKSGRPNSR